MENITKEEVILYLQALGIEDYNSKLKNEKYYNIVKQQMFSLLDSVRISKLRDCKDMKADEVYKSTTGAVRLGL